MVSGAAELLRTFYGSERSFDEERWRISGKIY